MKIMSSFLLFLTSHAAIIYIIKVEELGECIHENIYTYISAHNMALLAEEVCSCKAELLVGGMSGNVSTIVAHMCEGHPILIPYPLHFSVTILFSFEVNCCYI